MGRKEYWLKIRDEFSGYSWDYFMTDKSSTTSYFKETIAMNEGYRNTR
jgi:hypothetical protein